MTRALSSVIPARPLATSWKSPCGRSPLAGPAISSRESLPPRRRGAGTRPGLQAKRFTPAQDRRREIQPRLGQVPAAGSAALCADGPARGLPSGRAGMTALRERRPGSCTALNHSHITLPYSLFATPDSLISKSYPRSLTHAHNQKIRCVRGSFRKRLKW